MIDKSLQVHSRSELETEQGVCTLIADLHPLRGFNQGKPMDQHVMQGKPGSKEVNQIRNVMLRSRMGPFLHELNPMHCAERVD